MDPLTWLGLAPDAEGLVAWDVFDAVLTPGNIILLASWKNNASAEAFETRLSMEDGARLRRVRIVRDYGMFERREAPQYYPDVECPSTEGGAPNSELPHNHLLVDRLAGSGQTKFRKPNEDLVSPRIRSSLVPCDVCTRS